MKYQVIIIGGGPAGYTAGQAAAKRGLDCNISKRIVWVASV